MDEAKKIKLPTFAERFGTLRGTMTQAEYADFLGISRPTVGFYENGERLPDAYVLKQIAKKCGVTTDYLVGLSDVASPDADLQSACKYTGMNEKSVTTLHDFSQNYDEMKKLMALWDETVEPFRGMEGFLEIVKKFEDENKELFDIETKIVNYKAYFETLERLISYHEFFEFVLLVSEAAFYTKQTVEQDLGEGADSEYLDLSLFRSQKQLNRLIERIAESVEIDIDDPET